MGAKGHTVVPVALKVHCYDSEKAPITALVGWAWMEFWVYHRDLGMAYVGLVHSMV